MTKDAADPFETLVAAERASIDERREALGVDRQAPVTGLALSGGGIRSATFSLGLLQALSAAGLVPKIDYLSTVSGGSYIGSFFQALFVPEIDRGSGIVTGRRLWFNPRDPLGSPLGVEATSRLREAGRYLTPGGTSDAFFAAAVLGRNWTALHLVIGLGALAGLWCLRLADTWLVSSPWALAGFSPLVFALLWFALVFVLGSGAAYWLTRRDWIPATRPKRAALNGFFWAMVIAAIYCSSPFWHAPTDMPFWEGLTPPSGRFTASLAAIAITALLLYAGVEAHDGWVERSPSKPGTSPEQEAKQRIKDLRNPQYIMAAEDRVRTRLSSLMATGLMAATGLAVLAIIIRCGDGLLHLLRHALDHKGASAFGSVSALSPFLVTLAPPLLSYLASTRLKSGSGEIGGSWPERHVPILLGVAGLSLLACWLVIWSAVCGFGMDRLGSGPDGGALRYAVAAILLVVNGVLGYSFSFINLSSLSTFYAARLRRAYIGASSTGRAEGSVRSDVDQDTIGLGKYYAGAKAGLAPQHLINVTIAETVLGDSELVARDRKGKPMHLSPGGIVYEGSRPGTTAVGQSDDPDYPLEFGEELPLANWIAISGAAVSAAIGAGTSLGISILATLGNVRLGYWWKRAHARTPALGGFSLTNFVQYYLLLELRGAFAGTRRSRWYLTDGGHFENTGAYALLQRRVSFLIICDNGADPDYHMADVVRLLGRARTDLDAHIDFMDQAALKAKLGTQSDLLTWIGPFDALARRGTNCAGGGPIASMATIRYARGGSGTLLLIKPRLTFTEPPEILAYQANQANGDFPQQSTANQFFDEAQWEAYRRLGELAGERLFAPSSASGGLWRPDAMMP